jgi:hypothetical protein
VGDGCGGTGGGVQFHVGEGASSVEFLQHTLLFLSIKKNFYGIVLSRLECVGNSFTSFAHFCFLSNLRVLP